MRIGSACLLAALLSACATGGGSDFRGVAEATQPAKEHSGDARVRVQLGVQYLQRKQYDQALRVLNEAVGRYPQLPGPVSALALVYERLGDARAADASFRRAVDLDANDAAIRNNFANFLCRQGRYAEARVQFERAFEDRLYRQPAQLHANAGVCALRIPDLGLADIEFRKALSLSPSHPVALYEMAAISLKLRHYAVGLGYLDRFERRREHSPASLWLGVRLARGGKHLDRELRYARDLSRRFPDSLEAGWLLR